MVPTGEKAISCHDPDPKLLYGEKYRKKNLLFGDCAELT